MDAPRLTDGRLTSIADVALDAAHEAGAADLMRLTRLRSLWAESVGDVLANVSRAESLANGRLTVAVSSGTWAMTIAGMQKKLIASLRIKAPDLEVLRLRTVVGPIVDDLPPRRREAEGPPTPTRAELNAVELTASAQRAVEIAVAHLDDDEMKAHFAAAMRRSQQHRQWCLAHGWTIDPRSGDLVAGPPPGAAPPGAPPPGAAPPASGAPR
jgi:hypothetical protein